MATGHNNTGNGKNPNTKKQIEMEQRRQMVISGILQGFNYRDLAAQLGVSIGTVSNDVNIVIGRWQREQVDKADQWRTIQIRRIDILINSIWHDCTNGKLGAIDRILALIREQKALYGFDQLPVEAKDEQHSLEAWLQREEQLDQELREVLNAFADPDTGEIDGISGAHLT